MMTNEEKRQILLSTEKNYYQYIWKKDKPDITWLNHSYWETEFI